MSNQNSTNYPFIGEVAGERGGISELPTVDPALFSAPTETFSHFRLAMAASTLGAVALVSGGLGYFVNKFNGTQYAVPVFKNS